MAIPSGLKKTNYIQMKKRYIFFISLLFALLTNSCKYDFILPVKVTPITGTVSFSTQVAPIYSTANKCTACHYTGGQSPDLTAANAYVSIVPNLVNTGAPEQSLIYSFPSPATSTHTWKKYTTSEAAIVLAWIQQGFKNN
jgi:hypothetical protein